MPTDWWAHLVGALRVHPDKHWSDYPPQEDRGCAEGLGSASRLLSTAHGVRQHTADLTHARRVSREMVVPPRVAPRAAKRSHFPVAAGHKIEPMSHGGMSRHLADPGIHETQGMGVRGCVLFKYTGAVASHMFAGDGPDVWMAALVFGILTITSWALRPPERRMIAPPSKAGQGARSWLVSAGILVGLLILAFFTVPA
jgi:hypothetical protein